MAERAKLRVGAVIVEQAGEKLRDDGLPARVRRLAERALERRLVRVHEPLAHLLRRLPPAVGDSRRAVEVLDVLLHELAAIRAQRRVQELNGGDTVVVHRARRLPHAVEDPHDLVLSCDDVLGRQVPQPGRDGTSRNQRIGVVLGRGGQESKHVRSSGFAVAAGVVASGVSSGSFNI
jgi:hypothetical protein